MENSKAKIIFSWTLTALCMIVIFWLSGRNADISDGQSTGLLDWINTTFGLSLSHHFVRKAAHFSEFAGLSFLFNMSFYQTKGRSLPVVSTLCTSLYAATDEIHQLFVEGRACQFTDWLIDTAGALIGTAVFLFAAALWKKHSKERGKSRNTPFTTR